MTHKDIDRHSFRALNGVQSPRSSQQSTRRQRAKRIGKNAREKKTHWLYAILDKRSSNASQYRKRHE